jgi:TolB-like protein
MQALRKEPEWRYQTAAELRDDITRYLEGRRFQIFPIRRTAKSQAGFRGELAGRAAAEVAGHQPADTGPDYLGTGLADALITRLSAIRSFAVRPTSSVLRYGADADPLRAGRELGVAFVLDGRIRRAAERIRVTIQLLNVRDETTRGPDSLTNSLPTCLSLEDAISSHVAEAIVPHLTVRPTLRLAKRGTDNPQAHEAYLRGRFYWNTFTEDGFARAIVCYHQAIALDPNYALAYAGVANYHNWLGVFSVMPFAECSAAAYEAASTAVELDPNLAEGHAALGQAILCRDFAWASAEHHLVRAIELDPNYRPRASGTHCSSRWKVASVNRCAKRTPARSRSAGDHLALQPLSGVRITRVVLTKRIASPAPHSRTSQKPDDALWHRASCLSRWAGTRKRLPRPKVRRVDGQGFAHARRLGAPTLPPEISMPHRQYSTKCKAAERRYVSPYHLALVTRALGRAEEALDLLERRTKSATRKCSGWESIRNSIHCTVIRASTICCASWTTVSLRCLRLPAQLRRGEESIAVLPFRILGSRREKTPATSISASDLTDALITRLSNVQRLVVRPTSSVLALSRRRIDPLLAGRDLGVDYIVDGSLRRVGNRIRVTAQLLNVNEGVTRWAEQFDEDSTDVLQIEDSISEKVASALLPQLTATKSASCRNAAPTAPKRSKLICAGVITGTATPKSVSRKRSSVTRKQSNSILITRSPTPASPITTTGSASLVSDRLPKLPRPRNKRRPKQSNWIQLPRKHTARSASRPFVTTSTGPSPKASTVARSRSIQTTPPGHHWYAFHLMMEGRFDEAIEQMLRTRELDPLSPSVLQALGWCYYQARRFDESIATFQKHARSSARVSLWIRDSVVDTRHTGDTEEAVQGRRESTGTFGRRPFYLSRVGASVCRRRKTDATQSVGSIGTTLSARLRFAVSPFDDSPASRRTRTRAGTAFDAYAIKDAWVVWLGVEPQFDPLRGEPAFEDSSRPAPSAMIARPSA